jgi:hypothetical protein
MITIFKILDKHTLIILTVLENKEKDLKIEEILYELGSPVNDSFNIEELILKVNKTEVNTEFKRQVISNLNQGLK